MEGRDKPSAYLETTMFNLYFDDDRVGHKETLDFFTEIENGEFEPYTSDYTTGELEDAPEPKRTNMLALIDKYHIHVLPISDEAARLASLYIAQHDGIPEKKRLDALHIAVAVANHLDFCVSCNFRHINKIKTKAMVNQVNQREGYNSLIICRPEELTNGRQEKNAV
jgi:acyl-coenzyme A synthetase/AMP-(fatty) acid ligase